MSGKEALDAGTRWVVQSVGESVASVEVDGDTIVTLPRWLLPEDAAEGDVLAVTHTRAAGRASLVVMRDAAGTREALAESETQMRDAPVDTAGGDVTL